MDAPVDASVPAAISSPVADPLANGDQRTPLETWRQMETINSPLQSLEENDVEVVEEDVVLVVAKEVKYEDANEKGQRNRIDSKPEKQQIDLELALLKRQHEENEKQRQHEEKMELLRQQTSSRTTGRREEVRRLDPITELELEKMRMEFEMAKLRHLSEENERQRQHEWKMYENNEKQQLQQEEKTCQRHGLLRVSSQKASSDGKMEATAETSSASFVEVGKVRIEVQLAMEIYLPDMNEKKPTCEQGGYREIPKFDQQVKSGHEDGKPQPAPQHQETDDVTEHLGLQVPRIMVSGAEPVWSTSKLDLAIETELEKRRMEFELARLKCEHEDHERQRQHEEKMEQLRLQALPREEEGHPPGHEVIKIREHECE